MTAQMDTDKLSVSTPLIPTPLATTRETRKGAVAPLTRDASCSTGGTPAPHWLGKTEEKLLFIVHLWLIILNHECVQEV